MNVGNQRSNMLILFDTRRKLRGEMFVISASIDPGDTAERLNIVLKPELVISA